MRNATKGFVAFAHFTCQRRCALKHRTKENQSTRSMVTPMGNEMFYRYQESLIEDAEATLAVFGRIG